MNTHTHAIFDAVASPAIAALRAKLAAASTALAKLLVAKEITAERMSPTKPATATSRVTKKEARQAYEELSFAVQDLQGHLTIELKRAKAQERLQPKIDKCVELKGRGWPDGEVTPDNLIDSANAIIARWQKLQDEGLTEDMGRGDAEQYLRIDKGLGPERVAEILASPTSVRTTETMPGLRAIDIPSYTMAYLNAEADKKPAVGETDVSRLNAASRLAPKDAVFSDDPDAIEKLQLKLVSLQMHQEFMKKANKFVKKGDDAGLLAMGLGVNVIAKLKVPDYAGRVGFADYQLTNNNGVIGSTRKRIESLIAERNARERAEVVTDESEEVVEPAKLQDGQFYMAGDLVEYTGKTEDHAGTMFFEYRFLEGHKVGATGLTQRNPDGSNIAATPAGAGIVTPQVLPVAALEPESTAAGTADLDYLQSIINGSVDLMDEGIADRLEQIYTKHEADPSMVDLVTKAAEAYNEAVVKAAQAAMA